MVNLLEESNEKNEEVKTAYEIALDRLKNGESLPNPYRDKIDSKKEKPGSNKTNPSPTDIGNFYNFFNTLLGAAGSKFIPPSPEVEDGIENYLRRNPSEKINAPESFSAVDVIALLDKYVIGQSSAKESLAIAFSDLNIRKNNPRMEIPKSNVLIIGSTGTGKTYLVDTLAKVTNLPIAKGKLGSVTAEGYVGPCISDIFNQFNNSSPSNHGNMRYMQPSPFNPKNSYGIIYLDEIDKVIRRKEGFSGFSDELQNELIDMLEDGVVNGVSTKNILFITSGAFVGLENIVKKRIGGNNRKIGFGSDVEKKEYPRSELLSKVKPEDLVEYGFKPELAGRIPIITYVNPLTKDDLITIMNRAQDSVIEQNKRLFYGYGYDLSFTALALEKIADHAAKEGTGARALNSAVEYVLKDMKLHGSKYAKDGKIMITEKYVASVLK